MISRIFRSSGPNELLGDRRSAAGMAAERVERGGYERSGIEARVRPEVLVLDRRGGVQHLRRELLERHDLALELAELRQLRLAGSVGEDGLLVEGEIAQGVARVGQALAVVVVSGRDPDDPCDADEHEGAKEDDGDCDDGPPNGGGTAGPPAAEAAPMALPPREAGLHVGPHDSIGTVSSPSCLPVVTARRGAL
jgi:hypothetical protein